MSEITSLNFNLIFIRLKIVLATVLIFFIKPTLNIVLYNQHFTPKLYLNPYIQHCHELVPRYRKQCCIMEDKTACPVSPVPDVEDKEYLRRSQLPPKNVSPDLVLFCRRVYDYRLKRLLKNPL